MTRLTPFFHALALVCLPGLLGCGDDAATGGAGAGAGGGGGAGGGAANPRWTSGERLKIVVQRAGDAEQFFSIQDTVLGQECDVSTAADGQLRCVPRARGSVVYADAACTQPIVASYGDPCAPQAPMTASQYEPDPSGCGLDWQRSFEVGAAITTPPPTIFMRDPQGGCYDAGVGAELFALGPEIPPESMAAISVVEEPRGDALRARWQESDDGFRLLDYVAYDVVHQNECTASDGFAVPVCAPFTLYGSTGYFADATCSGGGGLYVLSATDTCPTPTLGVVAQTDPTDACVYEPHVYVVGDPVSPAYVEDGLGGCVEQGDPNLRFLALGAQIPDEELPAVEWVDEGTGPVRLRSAYAAGAPLLRGGNFVREDGQLCFPYSFQDGVVRCGPPTLAYSGSGASRLYADASCTQIVVELYPSCGAAPEVAVVAGDDPDTCAFAAAIHTLGAAHTASVYRSTSPGACAPTTPTAGVTYRLVGERIPDDQFVAVTTETLP